MHEALRNLRTDCVLGSMNSWKQCLRLVGKESERVVVRGLCESWALHVFLVTEAFSRWKGRSPW